MQYSKHLVILCEPDGLKSENIAVQMEMVDCLIFQSPSPNIAERFQCYASQLFREIQQLLKSQQEGKILVQLVIRDLPEHQLFLGLSGLLMTAHLENPNLMVQILSVPPNEKAENIVAKLKTNAQTPLEQRIDYRHGKRWIAGWQEIPTSDAEVSIPWKEKGIYLITGGLGGLGLILSQEIVQQICEGTIILTGRSPLNQNKLQILEKLRECDNCNNIHVEYRQVDVCDFQGLRYLIEEINQNYGYLNGIIHAAGVIHDNFIIKKTPEELEKVLSPKVRGLVNLDEATKYQPLDFFFCCSSLAGGIGNVGQADYACANAFMDCYAKYRNQLLSSHQRQGRTLSINWPLWQEGGMGVDAVSEKMMAQTIGLVAMPTSAGIRALYQALASNQERVMVLQGDLAKLKQAFLNLPEKIVQPEKDNAKDAVNKEQLPGKTLDKLKSLFAEITNLPLERVDPEEPLASYGIDSIMIAQLNQKLSEGLGSVSKTLFYQFYTLEDVANHLATTYIDRCLKWTQLNTSLTTPEFKKTDNKKLREKNIVISMKSEDDKSINGKGWPDSNCLNISGSDHSIANFPVPSVSSETPPLFEGSTIQPIAIIGLSGRYPKATTIAEFWQNLQNGQQCISEIPKNRWDWQYHYHADPHQAVKLGKSYSKWGGFLEEWEQFDPLFFNITPREAENIDPQERLFLQECWKAMEDAGYSPSNLSSNLRQRIGVFAGITKQGFNLYRTKSGLDYPNGAHQIELPTTSFASLVNRVSYHLNLQGPSFPVDTMCSSSLVAIHEACEYIRSGRGDMAVVGGVNLYAHPSSYLELCLGKFISSGSTCAAFEKDGDGFVPGEGVGVVILKSYAQAVKDHDSIYALIRGSAVNHDGKTNGYKTPNLDAKAAVIRTCLQDSDIDQRTISYIEAAAQGSDLGDAIEADALTEVFCDRFNVEGDYSIGSVKPNIGHCESASGMAQLTKVILSLTHKTLVPTLRSRELSSSIDFERLPFKLQQDQTEWKTVRVDGKEVPRRAGIMNIGAGGVNAHLIVEEYLGNSKPTKNRQEPVIFVLSAKNEERLEQYVKDWLIYLKNNHSLDLACLAYTLQVGRESMACRLAFVVKQLEEIETNLNRWLKTRKLGKIGFYGDVTQQKIKNPQAVTALVKLGDTNQAHKLAKLWVQGNTIPWDEWHQGKTLGRLSGLPTYPFAPRNCSIVPLTDSEPNIEQSLAENKAVEFYTRMSQDCNPEFQEEYLTFGAFPQKIPGFSMTRVAMNPDKYAEEFEMVKKRQRELRQVLFYREHFENIHTFLDIGCGHGTDVIQVAALYRHIQTHGFTITESQAVLGNRRIKNMNLASQARIYHKDSSKDKFPDHCDLILGVEVTFHIRNKDALFQKMADALSENGKILLMDYIGNLRGSIVDPNVEISIPTQQQWIDLLSKHDLIIDEIIDVSTEIANFLDDPEHAEHTKHLPQVSQDSYRNYANQAISLRQGWISYCLLKLKKDTRRSESERREHNAYQIANQTPYAQALAEMLQIGHIPYPPKGGLQLKNLRQNKSADSKTKTTGTTVVNDDSEFQLKTSLPLSKKSKKIKKKLDSETIKVQQKLDSRQIKSVLMDIFVRVLGWETQELQSVEKLDLMELGITSVNAVELLEAINTQFDLYLPTSIIFECHSWKDLVKEVKKELKQKKIILSANKQEEIQRQADLIVNQEIGKTFKKKLNSEHIKQQKIDYRQIKNTLLEIFTQILGWEPQELQSIERVDLVELGITSVNVVQLLEAINTKLDLYLPTSIIFECRNWGNLVKEIQRELKQKKAISSVNNEENLKQKLNISSSNTKEKLKQKQTILSPSQKVEDQHQTTPTEKSKKKPKLPTTNFTQVKNDDIAIIGISCRCAGAKNQKEFWEVVSQGKDCIEEINKPQWLEYIADHCSETFPIRYGIMPELDYFDPLFFHISPREAEGMDATHRVLLEECYSALEDAGYQPSSFKKQAVGTYIGAMGGASLGKGFSHLEMLGSETSILSARIAYFLDLKGPALTINTACSSSLVAIDIASKALKNGEIDLALAGGITLYQHPGTFISMHNAGMLSPTGQCRPFDDAADGIVVGDGVGVVILKRLSEAVEDGDSIYGIIRACGINQDGQTSGITVPSFLSQSELETSVYRQANFNLEDLQYIEAHGTSTKLGDPIEIHALTKSFQKFTAKRQFCAIGSLKANVGHTTAAAGVLSVIKVLLSIKYKQLPPSIHFKKGNRHIDFENSPVYVNTQLKPWNQNAQGSRLAAVSSFGFSGTNAHLVLEQYNTPSEPKNNLFTPPVFLVSAETEEGLRQYVRNVKQYLLDNPALEFADFLSTFQVGREAFSYRLAIMGDNQEVLSQKLDQWLESGAKAKEISDKLGTGSKKKEKALINRLISSQKVEKLAQLWQQGIPVDWGVFYPSRRVRRLAGLPTYPFAGEYFGEHIEGDIQEAETKQESSGKQTVALASTETLICHPDWREKPISKTALLFDYSRHLVFLCGINWSSKESIEAKMSGIECIDLGSSKPLNSSGNAAKIYQDTFIQTFTTIQEILNSKIRGKILIQCVVLQETEQQCFSAISGMLKTAQLENPKISGQIIEVSADETTESLVNKLKENSYCPEDKQIKYFQGQRNVFTWKELDLADAVCQTPWREAGVYLITGGAGGLGLIFATEIASKTQKCTLILSGRSDLSPAKKKALIKLQMLGAKVEYRQTDISNPQNVDSLIQSITKDYGSLHGIIHCAGILRDNYIIKKTANEFETVLEPKVAGVIYLDRYSKDLNLDFLVLFSSISGAMGNAGQADYATANAFMDAFASYRNSLVNNGQRSGQTLSLNWPLWQEGGMQVDAYSEAAMKQSVGLGTLNTAQGVQAFIKGINSGQSQILVATGNLSQLKQWLFPEPTEPKTAGQPKTRVQQVHPEHPMTKAEKQELEEKTLMQLKSLLGETFRLAPNRIKTHESFERYGIDSVMITQLNQKLAQVFPEISKTLFFEYQTSQALVSYLLEEYPRECMVWTGFKTETENPITVSCTHETAIAERLTPIQQEFELNLSRGLKESKQTLNPSLFQEEKPQIQEAIAIIGVSAHFAKSETLQAYWQNLQTGKDCVGEIPANRWSLEGFFVEDMDEAIAQGKSYSKWGSFLESFADFDPLFFGIPPRDVLSIDPQERLFLQSSWEALEDAGYTRDTLREKYQQQVGVFAGITKTGFDLYGPELIQRGEPVFPHTSFSSLANRTSYFLNLQGPSMPIDTMCSSALTAIHEACEHLRRRDCQLALAGGVNLYLHPSNYVQMCAMRMLSKDGQCKAFGQGGNGFVPGEGVGVVLLKPLSEAIRDRDNIHAIIRSSQVNHGGKTHGYTVPNPKAQAQLIRRTLEKGGIEARSISYIEAHGTGTELGDPIEITGLTQAFQKETSATGFCAIGSAKSNLGHLEAASGMAGLCKVLLQLKHRQLVPSLHAEELNSNIAFEKTPFVVQQTLAEWKRPLVESNGEVKEYPRRAGISAFGAGGSNAHLIVEEYIDEDEEKKGKAQLDEPVIIVLSAKNTEGLLKMADNLRCFLAETQANSPQLEDMAYTLQIGREAMEERLSLIVSSRGELQQKLQSFVEGEENIASLYQGRWHQERDLLADFATEAEFSSIIDQWIATNNLHKLSSLWVKGFTIDWHKLYPQRQPRIISLPTYPFAKDYYWFATKKIEQDNSDNQQNVTEDRAASKSIHYLQKQWVLAERQPNELQSQKTDTGKIAILSTSKTRLLGSLLQEELPNSQIIDLDNIKSKLEQDNTNWQEYGGCIDLFGCGKEEEEEEEVNSLDWMVWLQHLLEKGVKTKLKFLGVTKGLESWQNREVNLTGASRAGLYRMLQSEYTQIQSRHIDIDPHLKTAALAEQIAHEFWLDDDNCEICYREQKRYRAYLADAPAKPTQKQGAQLQFTPEEVLLITGGTGGLGLLLAQHFVEHYGVKRLVLSGREPLPPRQQWNATHNDKIRQKIQAVQSLEAQGVQVQVLPLTLSDPSAVAEGLDQITANFGPIAGILHCAGIVDSETPAFVRKSISGVAQVLEPKVAGLQVLLAQGKQYPLKFAVLFSSVSAIIPSLASGQSDYAMANAYMDYVAQATGGVLVSIQWPSWQETGMGAAHSQAYKDTGLLRLSNREGLQLLDDILSQKIGTVVLPALVQASLWHPQQLMQHQSKRVISSPVLSPNPPALVSTEPSVYSPASSQFTLQKLIDLFSQELGIPAAKLELDKSFGDYGLDSIWLAQLASKINQQLVEPLAPSILYEYSSLNSLASWLASERAPALKGKAPDLVQPIPKIQPRASGSTSSNLSAHKPLEIAVVGMACRFPGARNLAEYWSLLAEGKNSISPVPPERWSSEIPFYAGLIDNITDFDPAFFLIRPEDAKVMDPQALLVLEESLNLFYHAGYTLEQIKGGMTGVYLGARSQHRVDEADLYQARNPIVAAPNYLATHISQFFDLKGPSLVVDTACSSALVAMYFAIQSLLSGEINSAVVGGVSLLADEVAHRIFQQRNLLNQSSLFHVFDGRASGITLGEGVGLVLLKTLEQAQRDGDQIYAVIKGLAINNDGRTAGPATPNIAALKEVMQRALAQSGKQPQDIAHIEANGSGSEVTDLLELKAIEAIYRRETNKPCSLGSIKPNIGHPLCAEGIAGFIKLVCMLKDRQIVPFLSGQIPLKHYDLEASPFYFCRQSSSWPEASSLVALNCFADGGTNAHVIMEGWSPSDSSKQRQPITPPTLKRVNVRGNLLLGETITEEKMSQDSEEFNYNPWWGDR